MTRRLVLLPLVLLLSALLPMLALAQSDAPVAGRDYVVIAGGQPWQPLNGKIEVVEVFAYTCHHCADFRPLLDAWKRGLPRDVRVNYVPAAFNPDDTYSRAFFAAQRMGVVAKTHAALFDAIHVQRSVPMGNASADELGAFYRSQGVDATRLEKTMASAAVSADMRRARQFQIASGIEGTPTLIINGKYRVQARSLEDTLRIADQLIAMLRASANPAGTRG